MNESLYERLGGTDGIGRIVDDVMAAHLRNPIIKTRYEAIEDLDHATKMATEFFAARSGGPTHTPGVTCWRRTRG